MIKFFSNCMGKYYAVEFVDEPSSDNIDALKWLFGISAECIAEYIDTEKVDGFFLGPRKEMITPWSTSAVEIAQNMNIKNITRIEEFERVESSDIKFDKMLYSIFHNLDKYVFTVDKQSERVKNISDISQYNIEEGLALNDEEIEYLHDLSKKLNRDLTDGEIFGFSQVNSEHCRHKIFNGKFVIGGKEQDSSLFDLIKRTSRVNPNRIVSAYKDNCAFIDGPEINLFFPKSGEKASMFTQKESKTVISLKAETHNFPTTVEPFNGAATGSGGEIRDRMAGGRGSFPLAGSAVYMTSYTEKERQNILNDKSIPSREWLYQSPEEILIKASNGASDFGNKFGQPLICGSIYTFENSQESNLYAYDKVIMLAGGVGFALLQNSKKNKAEIGDLIVVMGGDNYRIGMGGGAVSSVATGEYNNSIELNAVQRSNPEMQKRVYNAIRSLAESQENSIISIHDHGAGGHLNCLSELVEDLGGDIDISKLPVGDPTLSAKEIIGNESQERMGMLISPHEIEKVKRIALRERAPIYIAGSTTGNKNFTLANSITGEKTLDLQLDEMFGSTPKTIIEDYSTKRELNKVEYQKGKIKEYLSLVLQMHSVACKDWLTNKVDRSVGGLVAQQQCVGEIQLPLANLGVTGIDYGGKRGIATALGHAPATAMINPEAASRIAIAKSLTNLVWTPIEDRLKGVSLSANWMWPGKNLGEDAGLYNAVKSASDFAIELKINIPTGKDSLSMTQKYPDGKKVISPGTLIITAVGECKDLDNIITPNLKDIPDSTIIYIPFDLLNKESFALGGSAFAQLFNTLGNRPIDIKTPEYFAETFDALQTAIENRWIEAGHDISSGGLITTLLEMNFPNLSNGLRLDLSSIGEYQPEEILFSEQVGVVVQVSDSNYKKLIDLFFDKNLTIYPIGKVSKDRSLYIKQWKEILELDIDKCRDIWYKSSYQMDTLQSGEASATKRFNNYVLQPLRFNFKCTTNKLINENDIKPVAAIIREKGSNGDREMAWALHLAGFEVKDVHMTDLIGGTEDLKDVDFIVFVGGFSNADTLGSAKGWAGAFLYNPKAKQSLFDFYKREDTLSLGICNGCQLMAELGLITPDSPEDSPKMRHNDSHKYESGFVGVTIEKSPSILLKSLEESSLGVWISHGEGRFAFPNKISQYKIALKYLYSEYPGNPNGSPEGVAGVCSDDGRHLAMMPHPERSIYKRNWAHYPENQKNDKITPWLELFINAKKWFISSK